MQNRILDTPVEYLKGVGPQRAELLKSELHIFYYKDLLSYFPFRYVDRTKFNPIAEITNEENYYQLKGVLTSVQTMGEGRAKRLVVRLKDNSGTTELVWFQGMQWIQKILQIGQEYIVYGKPTLFNGKFNFSHPDIELATDQGEVSKGLYPVYPSTEKLKTRGLSGKAIAKVMKNLLAVLHPSDVPKTLPDYLLEKFKLYKVWDAVAQIHFPVDEKTLLQATRRLKFEELFFIQLSLLKNKTARELNSNGFIFERIENYFTPFLTNHLPFELTGAQKKVLKEIRKNVLAGTQMNRLVQGDVGCGKTVVALLSMLMAIDNGFQTCLMAPTEILARQHFEGISSLIEVLDIPISILTGSTKATERRKILAALASGETKIIIGTHSLIEDAVVFQNLGLAVVDEQHKFGVAQRAALWKKNSQPPHVLVMTATPIPRTLAMTLYGDLDVSVIDELPPGRKPIKTLHKFDSARLAVFEFMRQEIARGRQIYVVYPLIEESEKLDFKDLMDGYESIVREFPLPDYRISIVHGRQKPADKEHEMQRFVKGETQIMVATTVIEVGVNVPNASVMIIESAERFGLSQLHQLRGRVGRGAEQSFCILMTGNKLGADGRTRMQTMVRTNDGFEIAEVDLEIRGPGDLAGTQQSGVLNLKLANIAKDGAILQAARDTATEILAADKNLEQEKNKLLAQFFEKKIKTQGDWSKIS